MIDAGDEVMIDFYATTYDDVGNVVSSAFIGSEDPTVPLSGDLEYTAVLANTFPLLPGTTITVQGHRPEQLPVVPTRGFVGRPAVQTRPPSPT